mmetsp:Transcript_2723/g.5629  ORF Transcript_2723/g.5629 Transcript_2723/m.5629 type:complete len:201 (+) Transcript_2723:2790-3392(+)
MISTSVKDMVGCSCAKLKQRSFIHLTTRWSSFSICGSGGSALPFSVKETSIFMKTTDADSFPVPSVLVVSVREDTTALTMLTPCMPRYLAVRCRASDLMTLAAATWTTPLVGSCGSTCTVTWVPSLPFTFANNSACSASFISALCPWSAKLRMSIVREPSFEVYTSTDVSLRLDWFVRPKPVRLNRSKSSASTPGLSDSG